MTCLNFKSTKSDQYRKGGKKNIYFFILEVIIKLTCVNDIFFWLLK